MRFKRYLQLAAFAALPLFAAQQAVAVVIDFDALPAGTPVTTISGVTFSSSVNALGYTLEVSDLYDTDSGENYLAVDDPDPIGDGVFLMGDTITLDFAAPITSLSVSFISTPLFPDWGSLFSIETLVGTAVNTLPPDTTLLDGGEVYRVTFSSATAFSSATLASLVIADPPDPFFGSLYAFNIDTIEFELADGGTVPVPGSLLLLLAALPALRRWTSHS